MSALEFKKTTMASASETRPYPSWSAIAQALGPHGRPSPAVTQAAKEALLWRTLAEEERPEASKTHPCGPQR